MSLWGNLSGIFRGSEVRASAQSATGSGTLDAWYQTMFGKAKPGRRIVTPESALRVMAVYASTRILSESMASLPIGVYQAQGERRVRLTGHPLCDVLGGIANGNNSTFEFVESGQAHLALRGNCYAEKELSGKGEILALHPMDPDKVNVRYNRADRRFVYDYEGTSFFAGSVLHIRGFSLDGLMGLSPVSLARETLELAMSAEDVGNEAFSEGFVPPIVLEVDNRADKDQRKTYRKEWVELTKDRKQGPPVVSGGMKIHTLRVSMEDLQFIQSRKFSIAEIARLFRVPLHMLAELDRATFSNVEHMSMEFVKYSLLPWIKRWEQRMNMSLLSEQERKKGIYMKFNLDALLRADTKTRYEAHRIAIEGRFATPNEVREKEEQDPYDGGDQFWAPLNQAPVSNPRFTGKDT